MENNLTAKEYFDKIKELRNVNTDEALDNFYDASLLLLNKYNRTGQTLAISKLLFILDTIPKERELIKMGINMFIYKEDINNFINKVEAKDVIITEISNFPRDIPDELVEVIEKTKNIFDRYFVLFTDYTGEVKKQIKKERDPILFGGFVNNRNLHERLYYLGDWEDEYCDLTLEKLISLEGESIVKTMTTPVSKEELLAEYNRLKEEKDKNAGWTVTRNNVSVRDVTNYNNQDIETRKSNSRKKIISKIKSVFKKG